MHQDGAWPWTICCFRVAKPWLSVKDRDCEQQTIFMTAQRIPNCGEHGHSVCDMSRPVLVKVPSLWKFPAFWKWYTSLWVLGLMRNPRKSWKCIRIIKVVYVTLSYQWMNSFTYCFCYILILEAEGLELVLDKTKIEENKGITFKKFLINSVI